MNWLPMALASAFFSASSDALAKALSRSASGRLLVWMRFFSASPWLLLLWPLAQPDTQTDRVFWFLLVIVIPVAYMIAVKRTSMIFAIFYGWQVYREKNLAPRLFAAMIMLVGILLIARG